MFKLIEGHRVVVSSQINDIHRFTIIFVALLTAGSNAQLQNLNDCTCPGSVSTYECTVFGDGFTAWQGSVFDCTLSGNEILLSHNDFESGTTRTCNGGAIIGRSERIMDNYYTSQLLVNFTSVLDGRSIQCMSIGGSRAAVVVGSSTLLTTRDPLPSPSDVRLISANPKLLTFEWSPVASNCSAVNYIIEFDCGTCPNITGLTSVNCSIDMLITSTSRSCNFAVKSVVCGNTMGNLSNIVSTTLKVPESPVITSITCTYSGDAQRRLSNLNILFSEVGSFAISDGIKGSSLYYVVTYFNAISDQSNIICGSDNISSSSCQQRVCTSSLPLSCYQNNGSINVSISASNILGSGLTSYAFVGTKSEYVDIKFESASSVICEFHNQARPNMKVCTISYGECEESLIMSAHGSTTNDSSNTVRLQLHSDLQNYCYTINATNGTFTALIEGIYRSENEISSVNTASVIAFAVIIPISTLCVIGCLLLGFCFNFIVKYHTRSVYITQRRQSPSPLELGEISHDTNFETDPTDMEYCERTRIGKEQILVHVVFEIDDKPWTLMHALEPFKYMEINIMDIKLSRPCMESRTRKIYIQCKSGLSREDEENIRQCPMGMMNIEFYPNGLPIKNIDLYGDKFECFIGYKYTRSLPTRPGSLYELLNSIYDLSKMNKLYRGINITDITFRQSQAIPSSTVVDIWFQIVTELPKNWKTKFDLLGVDLSTLL